MSVNQLGADTIISETYRVVRLIGRGGMGQVYEVRHLRTKARLALKILQNDGELSAEILQRFRREAEITSDLNHPNIVRVIDFNSLPDGRPFLVMELLEGRELARLIKAGIPLPIQEVAPIVDQIASALAAAHARGIVHRDLKPSNVFLMAMPTDGRELVKLLDFGISKVHDGASNLTGTDTIMGTPHYMSPEQARGKAGEADTRTDQFALAAIAYEMLTGHQAFPGDSPPSILYRVVHEPPPPLASWGISIPGALDAVVMRGLAKNAPDRFAAIEEFARAFAEAAWDPAAVALTTGAPAAVPAAAGVSVAARTRLPPDPELPRVTTLRWSTGQMEAMKDTLGPARASRGRRLAWAAAVMAATGGLVALLSREGRPPVRGGGDDPPVSAAAGVMPPVAAAVTDGSAAAPPRDAGTVRSEGSSGRQDPGAGTPGIVVGGGRSPGTATATATATGGKRGRSSRKPDAAASVITREDTAPTAVETTTSLRNYVITGSVGGAGP